MYGKITTWTRPGSLQARKASKKNTSPEESRLTARLSLSWTSLSLPILAMTQTPVSEVGIRHPAAHDTQRKTANLQLLSALNETTSVGSGLVSLL